MFKTLANQIYPDLVKKSRNWGKHFYTLLTLHLTVKRNHPLRTKLNQQSLSDIQKITFSVIDANISKMSFNMLVFKE